jgi:NTE family protein
VAAESAWNRILSMTIDSPKRFDARKHRAVERRHGMFTLVLSGGGARGFAHVGVLRVLEAYGFRPSALVGVSMGAVVGVTYSLRDDWYAALLGADTSGFPSPLPLRPTSGQDLARRVSALYAYLHAIRDVALGWGIGIHALADGERFLRKLTGDQNLEGGRIPIAVSATDLRSGERVILRSGSAARAAYASSALAGVLPPLGRSGTLLADGAYVDLAPIDVAREYGNPVVIAVDPGQLLEANEIRNGLQAVMRAFDICNRHHADLRFEEADLVLRPTFRRHIDMLDFGASRECVAAGMRVVRAHRRCLEELLRDPARQDG